MAKRNWDFISKQEAKDTMRYRDVYEDQQLERGHLQKKQTKTSRLVLTSIVALFVFLLAYVVCSILGPAIGSLTKSLSSTSSSTSVESQVDATESTGDSVVSASSIYTVEADGFGRYNIVDNSGNVVDTWTVMSEGMMNYYVCDDYPGVKIAQNGDFNSKILNYYDSEGNFVGTISDDDVSSDSVSTDAYDVVDGEGFGTYYVVEIASGNVIDEWKLINDGASNYCVCTNHPEAKLLQNGVGPKDVIASYYDLSTGEFHEEPVSNVESGESGDSEESSDGTASSSSIFAVNWKPTFGKVLFSLACAAIVYGLLYTYMMRNLEAQNMLSDTADINQYQNDQHIALPEEVQRKFDWFPDVGATSDVQFSSMISHMALLNKGLKKVHLSRRAETDIVDEDGDIEYYKGEVLLDDDGNPLYDEVPIIDTDFMEDLFQASGTPKDKTIRKYYDATKIPYNPDGSDRDKLGKFATVADLINADWEFPYYEPQRPAGAYIVDTAPVNTMVLAITRAGKGQWFGPFTHLFHYQWGKLVM